MSRNDKKDFIGLKITILIILVIVSLKLRILVISSTGYDALFKVPLFALSFLAIGYLVWDLFGKQISEPFASFLLQSGEKITKPKNYSKARALLAQNKNEEAIKVYEKLLSEDKFDTTAYCELADIYHYKTKNYPAAFNCYEKIEQYAQETTDMIFALNRKADIYLLNKDYTEAIKELEKIIAKFPKTKDTARAEERIKNLKKENIKQI